MAFVIDESFLPATLTAKPMSDDEFAAFCAEHPDLNFEMSAVGDLIVTAPTNFDSGTENADVTMQLQALARRHRNGFVGDSSTGFVLPNGARRSPDASWTAKARIQKLTPQQRSSFLPLCPDFVIEIKSASDRPDAPRDKLREYIEQGAQLGWLIDPSTRRVEIFRPNAEPETRSNLLEIEGEGPVQGFTLDLTYVWDPFAE